MKKLYYSAALITVFSTVEHCLGFLYRILLSRLIGAEGLGVYQMSLTVFFLFLTLVSSGLPITLSRTLSGKRASGDTKGERAVTTSAILIVSVFSVLATVLLFLFRTPFSKVFSDPRCSGLFYLLLLGLPFTSVYAVLRGYFWGRKNFFAYSVIELLEEMIMIVVGASLLLLPVPILDVNKTAFAVVVSYLCSFFIAVFYFVRTGGRLASPKEEIKPLLKSSLPVTAMRTSSSLINSLVSVLFPLCLTGAGLSSAGAMREYGIVYGMVMPVLMIPSSLVSSIAVVIVPELSECRARGDRGAVRAHIRRALSSALLIATVLIPFFLVSGEEVGLVLFSDLKSGRLISYFSPVLLPMCLTMVSTSLLNSLGCEKQTLLVFLLGSTSMLLCVIFLSATLGSGALMLGMALDFTLSAVCSLILLYKKAGGVGLKKELLAHGACLIASILVGFLVKISLKAYLGTFLLLLTCVLVVALIELVLLDRLRLLRFFPFLRAFFEKRRRKKLPRVLTTNAS